MTPRKKVGVVLFQLGGPDSLDAVAPFLYNLFCDPDIIDLPFGALLRKPLARYIAWKRSDHVRHAYAEIGNRSPILPLTERQARALEEALRPHCDPRVVIAMRYWHPFTDAAVRQLDGVPLDELVLLPLYPQYSKATTGSSLNEWRRCYRGQGIAVRVVEQFYDHPLYIESLVENINLSLTHFAPRVDAAASKGGSNTSPVHLVFSAHGVPVSFIERGDPYQQQIEATVRLVMARGGWANRHTLCYQSKVGRQKWLEPSLDATVERLAAAGTKQMLVIPIAFVTEHVETLHEINIEEREHAERLGVEQFGMMPALGDSPKFVAALADLVLRAVSAAPAAPSNLTASA